MSLSALDLSFVPSVAVDSIFSFAIATIEEILSPDDEESASSVSLLPSLSGFSVSLSSVNDANEEIFMPSLLLDDA